MLTVKRVDKIVSNCTVCRKRFNRRKRRVFRKNKGNNFVSETVEARKYLSHVKIRCWKIH